MAVDADVVRAANPGLTVDIPIIPFPELDTTGESIGESLSRCTSPLNTQDTTSTPASASFLTSSSSTSPSAPSSTTTTAASPTVFSPIATSAPTRRPERRSTLGRRLKIKSGVSLQVHDLKLRQYTDYDPRTGTPHSPLFSPSIWTGNTFGERDPPGPTDSTLFSSVQNSSNLYGLDEYAATDETGPFGLEPGPPLSILDVFAIRTVTSALNEPGVMARMRHFAESRGRARDIDFLLKVEEYTATVKTVETLLSDASLKLNGIAAPTSTAAASIKLPPKMTKTLCAETRDATTALLPRLDRVFDDAKAVVEHSLAQDIYPEFLKTQLSLNLQTIGPGYSPNQVCPGFGEAFCITDPHDTDNPVVYASDGLAGMTGYAVQEIIHKNCRFMQGPGTRSSGIERIRDAMAKNKEFSELVLNFKKDGRPFWNLIFVAPLIGLDGEVVYQLGGQIDVTEMLETQDDISCVLSYVTPLLEGPSQAPEDHAQDHPQTQSFSRPDPASRHSSNQSRSRRGGERTDARHSKYPPNASKNKFFRGFLRRYSSSSSSLNTVPPAGPTVDDSTRETSVSAPVRDTHSTPSTPTVPYDSRRSLNIPPAPTTRSCAHQVAVSPYSRFLVLEYIPAPASQSSSSNSGPGAPGPHDSRKSSCRHLQLPVAFCSPAAFECLGNGVRSVAEVVGTSIFDVLSDKANSPSVTKSFKSTVRASLAEGRNTKLDITLNGSASSMRARARGSSLSRRNNSNGFMGNPRPGSSQGAGGGGGGGGSDGPSSSSHTRSIRTSMSFERLVNRRNSADYGVDFVSYWTPLRDALGSTQWVVMILVPEVS